VNNSRLLSLLRPIGNVTPPRPPTMTPLEAQLLDLAMIARKAADGAGEPLPILQRGFVYPSMIGARCPSVGEVLS
jgi:hypothetical protein